MSRASKDCIFCGARPTTREHVWAVWLRPYFPRDKLNHTSGSAILDANGSVTNKVKRWGGDTHNRQLRVVCKRCNETWMSGLQVAAKPSVIPLVRGEQFLLTEERQHALAAWIAMSVICAEYFVPRGVAVSVIDRRFIYRSRSAPDAMRIWIGDFRRGTWVPSWTHSSLRISGDGLPDSMCRYDDGWPRANTQMTTLVFGRLYVHAFSCPYPEILNSSGLTNFVDSRLIQIWPLRHSFIRWPFNVISDRDADRLAGDIFLALDHVGRLAKRR
jgi:hypothetical protein